MNDKQKLQAIDAIVANAYEWGLDKIEHKGSFFEGVIASIFAILIMKEGAEE